MVFAQLADYLARQSARGRLRVDDPPLAARVFMEMVKGGFELEALMTGRVPAGRAEAERHVRGAVAIFLDGVAMHPAPVSRPSETRDATSRNAENTSTPASKTLIENDIIPSLYANPHARGISRVIKVMR